MRTVSKISFANENNTIEFYVSKALFLIYHQLEDLTPKIENKGCIMYKCLNLFKRASKWPKIIMHEAQQNYIYNLKHFMWIEDDRHISMWQQPNYTNKKDIWRSI